MARVDDWLKRAWQILDDVGLGDNEEAITGIAELWHNERYFEYVMLEQGGGEIKGSGLGAEEFAIISACLLIVYSRLASAAHKEKNHVGEAMAFYWMCRFAWNMSKVSEITTAAAKSLIQKKNSAAGKNRKSSIGIEQAIKEILKGENKTVHHCWKTLCKYSEDEPLVISDDNNNKYEVYSEACENGEENSKQLVSRVHLTGAKDGRPIKRQSFNRTFANAKKTSQ